MTTSKARWSPAWTRCRSSVICIAVGILLHDASTIMRACGGDTAEVCAAKILPRLRRWIVRRVRAWRLGFVASSGQEAPCTGEWHIIGQRPSCSRSGFLRRARSDGPDSRGNRRPSSPTTPRSEIPVAALRPSAHKALSISRVSSSSPRGPTGGAA